MAACLEGNLNCLRQIHLLSGGLWALSMFCFTLTFFSMTLKGPVNHGSYPIFEWKKMLACCTKPTLICFFKKNIQNKTMLVFFFFVKKTMLVWNACFHVHLNVAGLFETWTFYKSWVLTMHMHLISFSWHCCRQAANLYNFCLIIPKPYTKKRIRCPLEQDSVTLVFSIYHQPYSWILTRSMIGCPTPHHSSALWC